MHPGLLKDFCLAILFLLSFSRFPLPPPSHHRHYNRRHKTDPPNNPPYIKTHLKRVIFFISPRSALPDVTTGISAGGSLGSIGVLARPMACWHRGYAWKLLQTWGAKSRWSQSGERSRGSPSTPPYPRLAKHQVSQRHRPRSSSLKYPS
jgi:hypothetical protein